MCIIVTKQAGYKMPAKDILQTCFMHNRDGAGFMWADSNGVHIRKGYMTFDEFYKSLYECINDTKKYAIVMHFRISTQGGTQRELCHPYPITSDMKLLHSLSVKCDVGLAHNGIIPLTSDGAKDYNDTMLYIQKYASFLIKTSTYYNNKIICDLLSESIGASRLAILSRDGHIEHIGSGWIYEKADGLAYSNTSYKAYEYTTRSYIGYGYNYGWDDDELDDYTPRKTATYSKYTSRDTIAFVSREDCEEWNDGTTLNYYALYDEDGDIYDYYESDKTYTSASECVKDYISELVHSEDVREVEHGAVWV